MDAYTTYKEALEYLKYSLQISQLDLWLEDARLFPYQVKIIKYLNSKLINLGSDKIKDKVQAVFDIFDFGAHKICDLQGGKNPDIERIKEDGWLFDLVDNESQIVYIPEDEYEQDLFIFSWTNFMTSLCMRLKFQYAYLFKQDINQSCCTCGTPGQTEEDYESWVSDIYPEDESFDRSNYYRTNTNWGTTQDRYCDCYRNSPINNQ